MESVRRAARSAEGNVDIYGQTGEECGSETDAEVGRAAAVRGGYAEAT